MIVGNEKVCRNVPTGVATVAQDIGKANMTWDFWVYRKLPTRPGDQEPQLAHLGTVKEVRAMVENSMKVIWRGPFWCVHSGDGFEIEFDVGGIDSKETDMLDSINAVVRGRGDPLTVLVEFSRKNRLTLCDLTTGEELEFFSQAETDTPIQKAVEQLKGQHHEEGDEVLADLGAATPVADGDVASYTYFWANPGSEPHNFIALEGNELLIGSVAPETLEDFIDQYKLKGKVYVPRRTLGLGSQHRRLTGLVEMHDHINTPKCELVFYGSDMPTEIVFNSPMAKNNFIGVALGRVPKPKKTFEAERLLEGVNIPFLALTIIFSIASAFWTTDLILGLSILFGLITVVPLLKYFISGPQTYEVYSFGD